MHVTWAVQTDWWCAEQESDCVLAHDLAHPHHGHHPVPFLCLSDSNAEARVMYEAGVRYVIQSESLAVLLPHLRSPAVRAHTHTHIHTHTHALGSLSACHARGRCRAQDDTGGADGLVCAQGRAIRRQMHYQTLDKASFMKDYVTLHKADMEEEQSNDNRKALAPYL